MSMAWRRMHVAYDKGVGRMRRQEASARNAQRPLAR